MNYENRGNMKNLRISAAGFLLLVTLSTAKGIHAAELDITPLFAGYEHGCEVTAEADKFIVWANPDDRGHLAPISSLPTVLRDHIGTPAVDDRVDHWYVEVPLRDTLFHGLRVSRLERWYGKSNGISGWALVLENSLTEAGRLLDVQAFRLDESENFKPELIVDEDSKETKLVCDFSM